uniref:Uncharacterized protein n=2 Tax=Aegilops tauschii subsp. strangulata TaxID=200361 RepID=A0A453NTG8_AEGTS
IYHKFGIPSISEYMVHQFLYKQGIPCAPPNNEPSLLDLWQSARQSAPTPMRKGLGTMTLLVPWMIWKHRNDCVFNGARPSVNALLTKIRKRPPFGQAQAH